MKSLNYALVSSLCALVIGILLVTWPDVAVSYLVITIGVLFLIPGLVGLFSYLALLNKSKADAPRPVFPIVALGSTLFGVWLIIMPSFFVGVLMYVLGILLVLGGYQSAGQPDCCTFIHAGSIWGIYSARIDFGSGNHSPVQSVCHG